MTLVGLDVNATRARGVVGSAGATPHALMLDGADRELPLQISLQGRHPEVGRAAAALSRQLPHVVCAGFLAHLGTPKTWDAGRLHLNSGRAVTMVFERLRQACTAAHGVFLALPAYLSREQGESLAPLAAKARLPLVGSVAAPLAAALSAYAGSPWSGFALVVDADEYALTCALLGCSERAESGAGGSFMDENESIAEQAAGATHTVRMPTLSRTHVLSLPRLGLRTWKDRLIDAIADRCVRQSRRDPRDVPAAEQMLFDQLEGVLDACWQEQMVEVAVRGTQWSQNFVLRPEEVRACCAPLLQQTLVELRDVLAEAEPQGIVRVFVTEAAGKLPGLCEALQDDVGDLVPLIPLAADAAALGAHDIAAHFLRGAQPFEHIDAVISCPVPAPAGPLKQERKKRLFRF